MLSFYLWTFIAWFIILITGISKRKNWFGKNLLRFAYVVLILFLLEGTCLLAIKVKTGYWLFHEKYNLNAELFEPHPYLVGVPKKNVWLKVKGITYTHNSEGFRGKEFSKRKTKKRIIAIGGSTTYGTSVNDWETWPYYLDSLLTDSMEVLNFGVSGHSTVEHIIQSSLIVPEYDPDVVLIHCGLNDLRSLYIRNLACDYSDFHAPNLYGALGFCPLNNIPRIAMLRVAVLLLQKVNLFPSCSYYKTIVKEDHSIESKDRAIELYKRNLITMAGIYEKQGVEIVFIPQLLNGDAFEGNKLKWWIPFISDKELVHDMNKYNQIMESTADQENCRYEKEILDLKWKGTDFVDPSHLNPKANLRFAEIISQGFFETQDSLELPNSK